MLPKVSRYKEGILVSEYPMHSRIGLKEVKSVYEARMAICQTPHCLLVKLRGISLITDEAVEFITSSKVSEITKAIAVVLDSESGYYERSKQIFWLVKNIDKPKFPFEAFNDEDSALEWLSQYCNDL
jgi:hypothetical protein